MSSSTLIAQVPALPQSRAANRTLDRARVAAAAGFLLGVLLSFLGFAWDVQWHTDVGPDTFFTAPHLVLYGGVAMAGLTSLAMVLLTTLYARRGAPAALEGTVSILGGRFRGPAGYIIGGFGALFFLLFGLMDQWWHTLYGFDVTLVSPPHVGLILSIMVTMAGCLTALAWHVRTAHDSGGQRFLAAAGAAFAAAVLTAFITPTLTDLLGWQIFDVISWPNTVISLLYPAAILMTVSVIRRPWAGALFGVMFTALDLLTTAIIPGITRDYAASIGLFMRDNTSGEVVVTGLVPTHVLIAGILTDLVLLAGRLVGWRLSVLVPVAGAAAALALRLIEPNLPLYGPNPLDPAEVVAIREEITAAVSTSSLILAPLLGAAAGWFGWLLGIVLTGSASGSTPRVPGRAAATAAAVLLLLTPAPTLAHAPEPHHETIQAGPYAVEVGFSEWPIRAERSLDITFAPEGGIEGKTATIRITDPNGEWERGGVGPLGRHPRQRDLWGLDLIAFPTPGAWTIELTIDGPQGTGTGTLAAIPVGERPGPPPAPMWAIAALPLLFLVALGVRGWRQARPGKTENAVAWGTSRGAP